MLPYSDEALGKQDGLRLVKSGMMSVRSFQFLFSSSNRGWVVRQSEVGYYMMFDAFTHFTTLRTLSQRLQERNRLIT